MSRSQALRGSGLKRLTKSSRVALCPRDVGLVRHRLTRVTRRALAVFLTQHLAGIREDYSVERLTHVPTRTFVGVRARFADRARIRRQRGARVRSSGPRDTAVSTRSARGPANPDCSAAPLAAACPATTRSLGTSSCRGAAGSRSAARCCSAARRSTTTRRAAACSRAIPSAGVSAAAATSGATVTGNAGATGRAARTRALTASAVGQRETERQHDEAPYDVPHSVDSITARVDTAPPAAAPSLYTRAVLALATLLSATTASPAPCDTPPEPPLPAARPSNGVPRRATATPPGTSLTFAWAVTQLIPSPELAAGNDGALFGLRWQLTPFLYSFGIDSRLSPFRAFVVEPLVRTSGSIELFVAPEYLALDDPLSQRFGFRVGTRAHFPVVEHGDYLSVSVGTAYVRFGERQSASYQFGVYLLFGFLGIEQSLVPGLAEARWIGTLNVRSF